MRRTFNILPAHDHPALLADAGLPPAEADRACRPVFHIYSEQFAQGRRSAGSQRTREAFSRGSPGGSEAKPPSSRMPVASARVIELWNMRARIVEIRGFEADVKSIREYMSD